MTITLTEEQMMIVRSAMCDSSMKYLTRAFKAEEELKNLGREDREAVEMEMSIYNRCMEIINLIDEARA